MNAFRCRIVMAVILFASLGGCAGRVIHPQVLAKPSEIKPAIAVVAAPIASKTVKRTAAAQPRAAIISSVAPVKEDFWRELVAARRFTDCSYDPVIESWAKRLTQGPANFNANLVRIQPYLDYVWRQTQAQQMPSEVAFLPLVESDYRQVYGSYGSPGGWWQLMPETARGYRLDVTRANDERMDPIKSTNVALKLMHENAERFNNDWLLAIFAYNLGAQRIERVLSAKGIQSGQLEHVKQLGLPQVTENHLHRLIAWGCIFANPARYQVTLPAPLVASQRLTEVQLAKATPVAAVIATMDSFGGNFGLEWKNQHPLIAKKGEIGSAQSVLAPQQTNTALAELGDLQRFKSADALVLASQPLPASKPNTFRMGNTAVANRHGTSTVARVNSQVSSNRAPQSFKVRNGDNLWTIARRFDMRVNEILTLNPSVSRNTVLKLGHVLRMK